MHREAFCQMLYLADDGSEMELVWNSRDGVTPFIITLRSGKQATHAHWELDVCNPNYHPAPGERMFVDLTTERARSFATEKVDLYWDHPQYPAREMYGSREEAVEALAEFTPGAPDLVEVGE